MRPPEESAGVFSCSSSILEDRAGVRYSPCEPVSGGAVRALPRRLSKWRSSPNPSFVKGALRCLCVTCFLGSWAPRSGYARGPPRPPGRQDVRFQSETCSGAAGVESPILGPALPPVSSSFLLPTAPLTPWTLGFRAQPVVELSHGRASQEHSVPRLRRVADA